MRTVLILGGGGMVGQKLAHHLAVHGLNGDRDIELTLFDMGFPEVGAAPAKAQIAGDSYEGLTGGDYERGIVPGGQIVGAIDEELSCERIIAETVSDAERILRDRADATLADAPAPLRRSG